MMDKPLSPLSPGMSPRKENGIKTPLEKSTQDNQRANEKIMDLERSLEACEKKLQKAEKLLDEAHLQLLQHDFAFEMFLDLREHVFSSCLRNHSSNFNLSPAKLLMKKHSAKISFQGPPTLSGGYAAMDAILILERQHIDWFAPYKIIYGVEVATVKSIAEFGYSHILRVLNVVGGYRLAGNMELEKSEQEVFDELLHMIKFGRLEAATVLSRKFPFKGRSCMAQE